VGCGLIQEAGGLWFKHEFMELQYSQRKTCACIRLSTVPEDVWGSGSIAQCITILYTRWGQVVRFMNGPLSSCGDDIGIECTGGPVHCRGYLDAVLLPEIELRLLGRPA
jgi:hypothetical protein